MTRTDDLGGRAGIGSQNHCVHDQGEVTFTIKAWEPPNHYISDELAFGIPVEFTMQLMPSGDGTLIRIMCQEPGLGDPDELEPLFRDAARDALRRLGEILKGHEAEAH